MATEFGTWISIEDCMPRTGKAVLVNYKNILGYTRCFKAMWVAANTLEADIDDDSGWLTYDRASDTYYSPEGWYECVDTWDKFDKIFIDEGTVTHWMNLPKPPF